MNLKEAKEYYFKEFGKKTVLDCQQPPKLLEQELNIKGIFQDYNTPDNKTIDHNYEIKFFNKFFPYFDAINNQAHNRTNHKKAQNTIMNHFLDSNIHQQLNTEYKKLEEANPNIGLDKLKFNEQDFTRTFKIIHGMCSGYNISDMKHYLDSSETTKKIVSVKQKALASQLNIDPLWQMSSDTIKNTLKLANQQKTSETTQTQMSEKEYQSAMLTRFGGAGINYFD